MSTEPSRKRKGDKSSEDPPNKVPVADPSLAPHDVVLIVKGQKFYCLKEELAKHSTYFEGMFFKEFSEKDKKEVEIGELRSDVFHLFIDALNGTNSITDEYSEIALDAVIFLGSSTLEDKILQHFAGNSEVSLKEQFKMAEEYKTHKLMVQVCASIKDAYERDEVVPKDLDSFCNTTKNIVMQRSFELLGIRIPPSPPLPEERDQLFEHMMNQIIDQVEVQNYHGEVLKDQIQLLSDHMTTDDHFRTSDKIVEKIVRDDPLIKELLEQLRNSHEQGEKNFVQAQIQILTFKHIYTRMKNEGLGMNPDQLAPKLRSISKYLRNLSMILNRDERSQSRSHKIMLGNREIDEIYRRTSREVIQQDLVERPRNLKTSARWLENIRKKCNRMANSLGELHFDQRPRPDNLRVVSNRAAFRLIDEFVNSVRIFHYMDISEFELEHNEAGDINR